MSRIYDNQPLRNLPVVNVEYADVWPEEKYSRGNGYLLEGSIQNRAHFCVNQSTTKRHYYVFYLKISRGHRRQFADNGQEIEPNFSETKKVSTGFLNSSYTSIAKLDEGSSSVSNYAGGDSVGASWTDKIMDLKSSSGQTGTENEGVDEDEWDD